jgi:hypothetical protein
MGELAFGRQGVGAAPPAGDSVFTSDYLRAILDRLDSAVGGARKKGKSRKARMRRLTKRFEREALRVRWTYLLTHDDLTSAEADELSMLCRIFPAGR